MERNKKEYAVRIIKILEKDYGHVKCALNFSSPFELLMATILSAQCTDERVNKITENLFKRYKNVEDYANADILELESYIKSAGFFRNKAKNIIKSAKMIINEYNGDVPQTMKELLELSGVARKTANVVLGSAFGKSEGIAVDTHVIRIVNLLKLTEYDDPVRIEKDLMKTVPKKHWLNFSLMIQTLGRRICKSRNPDHIFCSLNKICPSVHK